MQVQGVEGQDTFFRTRTDKDGWLHVWAPGWRLEARFLAFVPPALAVGFLLSNLPIPVRLLFAAVLVGCGLAVQRMTSIGIVLTADEVRLVGIVRTRSAPWGEVAGFVGERDAHEGRPVLLLADGSRIKAPGSLPSTRSATASRCPRRTRRGRSAARRASRARRRTGLGCRSTRHRSRRNVVACALGPKRVSCGCRTSRRLRATMRPSSAIRLPSSTGSDR
jgi:hypothetical protein